MTGHKKIQRAPKLHRKRQTAGVATGGVNVRFRAHQYSTRHIDIVFRYGENSLRVPRRCPHDDKCCENAHNTFHMTWKCTHGCLPLSLMPDAAWAVSGIPQADPGGMATLRF